MKLLIFSVKILLYLVFFLKRAGRTIDKKLMFDLK